MKRLLLAVTLTAALLAGLAGEAPAASQHELFGDAAVVPGGHDGMAARLTSEAGGFAGVSFSPAAAIPWTGLEHLSAAYDVTDDGCGGGSPRFSLGVDTGGDGIRDGVVHVAIGPAPGFTGCPAGWQATGELVGAAEPRYDFSQFGGSPFAAHADAPADVQAGSVVTAALVVDGSWNAAATGGDGEQTVLVDDVTLNGETVTFDCSFTKTADTWTLDGDCTTSETIVVDEDVTLDGEGHTITAVDPAGDHFRGAVVEATAQVDVTDLRVTASDLADVCDAGDDRLRGILFDGASGSITGTEVVDLRQGESSGCQEGNAIEARSFDGAETTVTIEDNTVSGYQKNGITVNGDVEATITGNDVSGDGPVDTIAQNGIQVGFGAYAAVTGNTVSGNDYTPASFTAAGILLYAADARTNQQLQRTNELSENEIDVVRFANANATPFTG